MRLTLLILIALIPAQAAAGVAVRDDVAVTGRSVMLRAETRERFFRAGGVLVEFLTDGRSMGRTMSGGDGIAYREFEPLKAGLYVLTVLAGDEKATAHLLVVDKGEDIVLVDVLGSLLDDLVSRRPREGSVDALMAISRVHNLVYMNVLGAGGGFMKSWLEEQGFPDAPLLSFGGGEVFERMAGLGLTITAVVGSARCVSEAAGYTTHLLSFESAEGARRVSTWAEIEEALVQEEP